MNPYNRSRRTSLLFTVGLAVLALCAYSAVAQVVDTNSVTGTNAPPAVDASPIKTAGELWNSLLLVLVAVIAPMITRLSKFLIPKIPSSALPFLSPALIWLINLVSTYAGGPHVSGWLALILGAAGTGLREVKEQIVPSLKLPTTAAMILLFGCLSIGGGAMVTGCALTRTHEAIVYDSYRTTYNQVRNAYKLFDKAYLAGKVSAVNKQRADAAWNQFREVFKASFIASASNWSAPVTPEVKTFADNMINIVGSIPK